MDINQIHPELRAAVKRIPSVPFHNPILLRVLKWLNRLPTKDKLVDGVAISTRHLHNASVRIYQPLGEKSGAGLLWIHGGGYLIGTAATNDNECIRYARELKLVVASVQYRLAPEHPFPAASDDCFEAWQWFRDTAPELGVDPQRIVVSGQSAGGGLAAGLAQRIVDSGGIQPAGQVLFCPMIDDRTALDTALDDVKHRIWNNVNNRGAWAHYLGQPAGLAQVAEYAAPARRQSLQGLPPAWVGVGDAELFYEETRRYAEQLQRAGVSCQLEIVPGAPHAFETFAAKAQVTRDYLQSHDHFLRTVLRL